MTCFGNSTMAFATWRVWQAGRKISTQTEPRDNAAAAISERWVCMLRVPDSGCLSKPFGPYGCLDSYGRGVEMV